MAFSSTDFYIIFYIRSVFREMHRLTPCFQTVSATYILKKRQQYINKTECKRDDIAILPVKGRN